jgi:hypothetical protein
MPAKKQTGSGSEPHRITEAVAPNTPLKGLSYMQNAPKSAILRPFSKPISSSFNDLS